MSCRATATGTPEHRSWLQDALALACAKLAVSLWVLHQGFTHVSDDDYARVVISEQFAHAPRLDPSGTSWLPFPFWVEGSALAVAGRSLGVARAVAVALGCASVVAPYLAMRAVRVPRAAALGATVVALAMPWNAWLGAATVPEGWVGAITAASVVAVGSHADRASRTTRGWAVAGVLVASLSRYEAWPACVVVATVCALGAAKRDGSAKKDGGLALAALAGPLAWMGWNAHAHGSPVHFLARVAAFRHTVGAADVSILAKLAEYPLAFATQSPEAMALGVAGALVLGLREVRARWTTPVVAAVAVLSFLVWGDAQDGAPTHHPVRALAMTWWVSAGLGAEALVHLTRLLSGRPSGRRLPRLLFPLALTALVATWGLTVPFRWAHAPGETPAEARFAQIARGMVLRLRGVSHARIAPCSFEHFALLAAWGAPERATVLPPRRIPVTDLCPEITEDGAPPAPSP